MLGPLLFVYRRVIVKKFVLQIFFCNSKREFQKSLFYKKKLFTEHEFEKCWEAKKMYKGHFNQKNLN